MEAMGRKLEIILFTFAPLTRLECLVAQVATASPAVVWVIALRSHAFVGFPLTISWLLGAFMLVYSFAFSIRRLLDIGVNNKAEAIFYIMAYNGVSNILAMGMGKSILPVAYCAYYAGLLLIPSARPRAMWTQDLSA